MTTPSWPTVGHAQRGALLVGGLCALAWTAVLVMVRTGEGVAEDDGPVLRWLVGHRTPDATLVLGGVSSTPVDVLLVLAVLAVVAGCARRTRSVRPLLQVGVGTGAAVVLAEGVKVVVARPRPAVAVMLGAPESGSGFPSAHSLVLTALLGAMAVVVWQTTRRASARAAATTVALGLSAAMGASRLYLGDHWLTDVLAGYLLAGVVVAGVVAGSHRPGRSGPAPG